MDMNERALDEILGLPQLKVKSCNIGRIHIKLSVTKLQSQPVRVTIDRVKLVLEEPLTIEPVPTVIETLLKQEDDEKPPTKEEDIPEKEKYALGDKIADGVYVSIERVEVEVCSLGRYKERKGEWTPPVMRLLIENVLVQATDSEWNVVTDLKTARETGKSAKEFDVFRMITVGAVSASMVPHGHEDAISLLQNLPVSIHVTTRKTDAGVVIAAQTDLFVADVRIRVNSQTLIWLMEMLDGLGDSFGRASLEGDQYKVHVRLLEAKNIVAQDKNGYSDPYARVRLKGSKVDGSLYETFEIRSRTKKKTLNPKWDAEDYSFTISHPENAKVSVSLWDWDRIGKDAPLGSFELDLKSFAPDTPSKQMWVPLENVPSGEVLLEIDVINWSKKVKPHPLKYLNIGLGKFRFELVEDELKGEVVFLGKKMKVDGVSGFAIEGSDLNFGTIKPAVSSVTSMEEFFIQLRLGDLNIISLDQDRSGSLAYIVRAAPRNIQISHFSKTTVQYTVCSLRRKTSKSLPVIRDMGVFGEIDDDTSRRFNPTNTVTVRDTRKSRHMTSNAVAASTSPADFKNPSFLRLKAVQRSPFPAPPLVGPEIEAIVSPVEVTLDIILLQRLVAFLNGAILKRPRKIPPQDLIDLDNRRREFEREWSDKHRPPRPPVSNVQPPPVFRLNAEVVSLSIVIPSPNRVVVPDSPVMFFEMDNVLIASHKLLAPTTPEKLTLSTLAPHVFPSDITDFSAMGTRGFLDDLTSAHNTGLDTVKVSFNWDLMSLFLRPFPKSSALKLVDFHGADGNYELQADHVLHAIQGRLPSCPRYPVIAGGFSLQNISGIISQQEFQCVMYLVNEFKSALVDLKVPLSEDPSNEAAHRMTAHDAYEKLQDKTVQDRIVSADAIIAMIPIWIWSQVSTISVRLVTDVSESVKGTSSDQIPSGKTLAEINLNDFESMFDNQFERSCLKLWWKGFESLATDAFDVARLDKLLSTLDARDFPGFFAFRFVRKHGMHRISEWSDVKGLDRGSMTMRFGGMHIKGHLVDVIPLFVKFFSEKFVLPGPADTPLAIPKNSKTVVEEEIDGTLLSVPSRRPLSISLDNTSPPSARQSMASRLSTSRYSVLSSFSQMNLTRIVLPSRTAQRMMYPDYAEKEDVAFVDLQCIESSLSRVEQLVTDSGAEFEMLRYRMVRNKQLEHSIHEDELGEKFIQVPIAIDVKRGIDRKEKVGSASIVNMYKVYHAGWLTKRGTFFHSWKYRYHRLVEDRIFYFRSPDSLAPLGEIPLDGSEISHVDYHMFKKHHAFQILTSKKVLFVFSCKSEDELSSWDVALQAYKIRAAKRAEELVDLDQVDDTGFSLVSHSAPTAATGMTEVSESSIVAPPVSDLEMDRLRAKIQETEAIVSRAVKDKDALFSLMPLLYQRAQDIRSDSLRQEILELRGYTETLRGMLEASLGEAASAKKELSVLKADVRKAALEDLKEEREQRIDTRVRLLTTRSKLREATARELIIRGVSLQAFKRKDEKSISFAGGKWKERVLRVVEEKGAKDRLLLGWSDVGDSGKPRHTIPISQIDYIEFGKQVFSMDRSFASISAFEATVGFEQEQLRSFSVLQSNSRGLPLVFRCSSWEDTMTCVLGIQSFVREMVAFSLKKEWTEGSLLWSRARATLMVDAQAADMTRRALLRNCLLEIIEQRRAEKEAKEAELKRKSKRAVFSPIWLKVSLFETAKDRSPKVCEFDASLCRSTRDIKARVRQEFRLPIVLEDRSSTGAPVDYILDLFICYTDKDNVRKILSADADLDLIFSCVKSFDVFQHKRLAVRPSLEESTDEVSASEIWRIVAREPSAEDAPTASASSSSRNS
eukprot:ANDGO_06393.mRNA.1 BAG-associated GRAM protein 1